MSRRSAWEPSTEAEMALYDALLVGDQERYFRILAGVELLLPVSAEAAAGRAPMGWATWTSNDHTHLLAFTSLQSMRTCLAEHAGAARKMAVADLATVWPNQDWWLAVNPGLSIEGYLPPWFVAQLGRGDARLPNQLTSGPRDRLARVQALERAKAARAAGAQRHQRDPLRVHATVSRVLPAVDPLADSAHPWLDAEVTSERTAQPLVDEPSWAARGESLPRRDRPAESSWSSSGSAAAEAVRGESLPRRDRPAESSWPGSSSTAQEAARERAVDEPSAAARNESLPRRDRPVESSWPGGGPTAQEAARLQSAHERAVDELAAAWSSSSAVRDFVGDVSPATRPEPARPTDNGRSTRGDALRAADSAAARFGRGATAARDTDDVIPQSRVGAPAGSDTSVAPSRLDSAEPEASKSVNGHAPDRPRHAEPEPSFIPANQTETDLFAAAEAGNTDTFLSTLLLATVYIPKGTGTENGKWRPQPIDGEPHLICYTSSQHLPDGLELVPVKFLKLIVDWPDPSWSFAVNPGSPVGATLPGGQLLALASWAREVGLIRDDDAEGEAVPAEGSTSVAGRAPELTVLQKAIAPSKVSYYLDRGYDRVSGFVHRAHEVGHLRDAQQMRRALGLDYEGSPFLATDREIYLLRWSAYRPNLYRIPYGGQTEAGMKAMQGWVVERAPFRGNGFAPGESKEIIAEFKVDSARLPHGARLIKMRDDGQEIIVAVLDADDQKWLRTDGVGDA